MNTKPSHRWSRKVTEHSHALDLEEGVFKWHDPRRIALSMQRSAMRSQHRKGSPLQSAMSMLNFYLNRAGSQLPAGQKNILLHAKEELRRVFGELARPDLAHR
ncbi:MAG TPA: DUF3175 domain-containing protein [Verrucomicrobiae bacterium]